MNNFLKNAGSILMLLSFLFLLFIYYPILKLYFGGNSSTEFQKSTNEPYIEIKKINVLEKLIFSVDPFDEKEYRQALQNGIAQAKGTAKPGEEGTIFLFAHSSDLPWRITRYNIAFFRLGELEKNDEITLTFEGKKYLYTVDDKKIVKPDEVDYLSKQKGTMLILQTCYPLGSDLRRLLIFAKPL